MHGGVVGGKYHKATINTSDGRIDKRICCHIHAYMLDPDSVFSYYKKLIALRRNSPWSEVIVYGDYTLLAPEDESVFAYTRKTEKQQLLVVCNLTAKETDFTVPESVSWNSAELVVGTNAPETLQRQLKLAPWSASVWSI